MTPNRLTEPKSPETNLASRTLLARMFLIAIFLATSAVIAGITGNASADTPIEEAPGPPWLIAETASKTQIDLSWTSPSNDGGASVTGFKVEVSDDNGGTWSDLTTTKYNVHSHTGLDPDTTRWYRVSAINSVGTGTASNVATATTYPSPPPPENLRAEPRINAVALWWDRPESIDGGFLADFEWRQSTDGIDWGPWQSLGSARSIGHTVTGLDNGTEYHFEVRAGHALLSNHVGIDSEAVSAKATPNPQFKLTTQRSGIKRGAGDDASGGPMKVRITLLNGTFDTDQDFHLLRGQGEALAPEFAAENPIQVLAGENNGHTVISALVGGGTQYYDIPEYRTLIGQWQSGTGNIEAKTRVLVFDDEQKPSAKISINKTSIREGQSATVTVRLSPNGLAAATDIKVTTNDPNGRLTDGRDRTLTFGIGETTKAIPYSTIDDDDPDSLFPVSFFVQQPKTDHQRDSFSLGDPHMVNLVVTDNDKPKIHITAKDSTAYESNTALVFGVQLDKNTAHQVKVDYRTAGDTATAGTDYVSTSGTLVFGYADRIKTVRVRLIDDEIEGGGETFRLILSNPRSTGYNAIISRGTATGTITNQDEEEETEVEEETDPFTASFSGVPDSHDGSSEFSFTLTLSEEPKSGFSYETLRDDAFEVTNGDVTKARRQETDKNQKWTIFVTPDGDDDVTVTLPSTTSCSASGAICTDDDRKLSNRESETVEGPSEEASVVVPSISIADSEADEGEDVSFTVLLSEATTTQVSVNYATSSGSATEGTDFSEASSMLNFEAGTTSKTITVSTTEDTTDESDETFTVTLSSPSNATLGDSTATGTIKDDDEPPPLTVSLKNQPQTHDGSTAFTFEIHFSEDLHDDFSYESLRDDAFNVTNGTVNKAKRINPDSNTRNKSWPITVTPSGNGNTTITLPITTSCSASGAICTGDKSKLSTPVSFTVNGPGS